MALAEELGRFVATERTRAGSRERLSGFSHAIRLLGYVHHARDEQEEASAEFLINLELQKRLERRLVAAGRRPGRVAPAELGPEQRPLWEEGDSLSETVVRHSETFYVFARLLLDRLAQAIERYFGRVEEAPLRDHLDVERNLAVFAAATSSSISSRSSGDVPAHSPSRRCCSPAAALRHRGSGFGPVAVTSRCGTQSSTWTKPSKPPTASSTTSKNERR